MNIAVVGSGMTGLAAAWMLSCEHRVTLFDHQPVVGLIAHSFGTCIDGRDIRGDVPSRMFNGRQWPTICRLLQILNVPGEAVQPSVAIFDRRDHHLLRTADALRPWQMKLSSLASPATIRILRDARRLHREGQRDAEDPQFRNRSMATYLRQKNYGPDFIYGFLYPILSSTVCTCSHAALDQYPASILLNTLRNLTDRSAPLLRVRGGVSRLCERMLEDSPIELRLGTRVASVRRKPGGVEILSDRNHSTAPPERFEHVVLAIQANHARRLVEDLFPAEADVLDSVRYESVTVRIEHRDSLPLPPDSALETFNIWPGETPLGASRCVVWMNRFHTEWPKCPGQFQVIQPGTPDSRSVDSGGPEVRLQRPIVTTRSWGVWQQLAELMASPDRRVWFAGSFAEPGVPLLESAVRSAVRIVATLDPGNEKARVLLNCKHPNPNTSTV